MKLKKQNLKQKKTDLNLNIYKLNITNNLFRNVSKLKLSLNMIEISYPNLNEPFPTLIHNDFFLRCYDQNLICLHNHTQTEPILTANVTVMSCFFTCMHFACSFSCQRNAKPYVLTD